jgi:hypothetical protein
MRLRRASSRWDKSNGAQGRGELADRNANIRNLILQIDVEMSAFVVYLFSLLHSYYSITAKLGTPRPPSSP